MRHAIVILLIALTGALHAAALDGRTFEVVMREGEREFPPEQLVFADGELAAPAIEERYGFAPGAYRVERTEDGALVQATLSSAKHGTVAITATVTADGTISGTRRWTKGDKQPIDHHFRGALHDPAAGR